MNPLRFALLVCLLSTAAACQQQPAQPTTEPAVAPPSVTEDATPPTPADPNAINDALIGDAFKATISVVQGPRASKSGSGMEIVVKVANEGMAALYGVGTKPVNLGVQILGDNDDVGGTGGIRDFMRTPLPYVSAGTQSDVVIAVPADPRLENRKLRIALVQEAVGWHDEVAEKRIDLGPFRVCGVLVCDAAGNALPN